jgi:hypothetical protein
MGKTDREKRLTIRSASVLQRWQNYPNIALLLESFIHNPGLPRGKLKKVNRWGLIN